MLIFLFVSVLGIKTQQFLCVCPCSELLKMNMLTMKDLASLRGQTLLPTSTPPPKHTSLPDSGGPTIMMNRQTICVSPVMKSEKLDQRPVVC